MLHIPKFDLFHLLSALLTKRRNRSEQNPNSLQYQRKKNVSQFVQDCIPINQKQQEKHKPQVFDFTISTTSKKKIQRTYKIMDSRAAESAT